MLASPAPLKTALAYDVFQGQSDSSLAVPSDKHLRSRTSGDQRVKEQVLMTVKRQKPRSSQSSSTLSYTTRGSMYDGVNDNYNTARTQFYSKQQAGSSSWGYPQVFNGTLKKDTDNKRFSSYSQMENWNRQYKSLGSPTSPSSDFVYMQNLKNSRSEPDLTAEPRATLRKQSQLQAQRGGGGGGGGRATQSRYSFYSNHSTQQNTQQKKRGFAPTRTPSSISGVRQEVYGNGHAQMYNTMQKQESYGGTQSQMYNTMQKQESYGGTQSQMYNTLHKQDMYGTANMPIRDEFDSGMSIEKAIELLSYPDEKYQTSGAYNIQHACYQDENAKNRVCQLNGIEKLIVLLHSPNHNVQQAAAGALRNLVFKNTANKIETSRRGGIREAVSLLKRTSNPEIQKQLTGLLWNLSSTDELKAELIQEALPVLTDHVIIPYSGWSEYSTKVQRNEIDPEVFFNATGCLRNLSSADAGRQTMRNCRGLVDSLVFYAQSCVAANQPDNKSVENCTCILHNLSYHLDSEVPNKYTDLTEKQNQMARNHETDKTSMGCFSNKSDKVQSNNFELPLPEEESNPRGSNLLFHSNTIRTYLALLGLSKKDSTLEACAGALQNLTASKGLMSNGMSQIIGVKEKGLPHIARLLQSGNSDVVKTGTSLLSNLSRHPALHKSMGNQVLPDVARLLSHPVGNNTSNSEDILSSACYTMRNLVMADPQLGKQNLSGNLLSNVVNMCKSSASPKAAEAARVFLSDMWSQKELQSLLKQQGLDKNMMGALTGSTLKSVMSRAF
ncbi:plakophilin-1 isoform X2 [Rhinatrema bivittatum]|uniref:plakophilin-1 isoform X2 n=1 Tax=Rhinatrema bivittatum TaxID=194408 RepID=UPI00112D273E|nr:plakophilin-1 isoform X2 [Rhinatrema bivittatum]